MIISFNRNNGGGGIPSSALTNYWDSAVTEEHIESAASITYASAASYADLAVAGIDLSEYLTSADTENFVSSAQVQTQIDASVSGKANAVSVTPRSGTSPVWLPTWNAEGIITGESDAFFEKPFYMNGFAANTILVRQNSALRSFYAPNSAGTAGDILMSSGQGNAPVWVTPATINGSAITAGGNLVIEPVDLTPYWTSAETEAAIAQATGDYITSAYTGFASSAIVSALTEELSEVERVASVAINDLRDKKVESEDVHYMVKLSQAAYDTLVSANTVDNTTLYIITGTTI